MSQVAILVGSVYGGAEDVADETSKLLSEQGHQVNIFTDSSLDDVLIANPETLLVITSTTGQGDVPANLEPLYFEIKDKTPDLRDKQYAVIAMGDSSYGETFCQAGKQFDEVLTESMAAQTLPLLEIDACETMDAFGAAQAWLGDLSAKL